MSVEIEALSRAKQRRNQVSQIPNQRVTLKNTLFSRFGTSLVENNRLGKLARRVDQSKKRAEEKLPQLDVALSSERERIGSLLNEARQLRDQGYYPQALFDEEQSAYDSIFPPPPEPSSLPQEEPEVLEENYKRFTLRKVPYGELQFAHEVLRGEHEKEWTRTKRPTKEKPAESAKEESASISFRKAARTLRRLSATDKTPDHSAISNFIAHVDTKVLERLIQPAQR